MQSAIIVIAILLMAILIWRSREAPDAQTEQCLNAVLTAIKQQPDIEDVDIAGILRSHGFDMHSATKVTRLVKPRLAGLGIRKEQHAEIIHEVTRAKQYLEIAPAEQDKDPERSN